MTFITSIFNNNKLLWGSSNNPGNVSEEIPLTLTPGRYYILVQRLYGVPEDSIYQVVLVR
jgi:hypothetical protein